MSTLVSDDSVDVLVDKCTQTTHFPLLNLPQVVIDKVISLLSPQTCLMLRRVCKTTHNWIMQTSCNSLEIHKWKQLYLCITGKAPRTFSSVVSMNLPITGFHIQNNLNKEKIYESEGVDEFVEHYKGLPVNFVVDVLFMLQPVQERLFYSSFEGITKLRIKKFQASMPTPVSKSNGESDYEELFQDMLLPPPLSIISSVKVLIIDDLQSSITVPDHLFNEFVLSCISSFKNLEYLSPPAKIKKISRRTFSWVFRSFKSTYCPTWVNALQSTITANECSRQQGQEILTLDLRNFLRAAFIKSPQSDYIQSYVKLLQEFHQCGFSLRSIYSPLIESMYKHWQSLDWSIDNIQDSLKFLDSVASIFHVADVLLLGLYDMKKLEIVTIFHNFEAQQWLYHNPEELSWDLLKNLKVHVNVTAEGLTDTARETWNVVFRRVFDNTKRSSVTSLWLKANTDRKIELEMMQTENILFDVSVITTNFSCLRSLTIYGWNASSNHFHELFAGLPQLVYLSVAACKGLDNEAFTFLPPGFKRLVLNLDKMPKITEELFTLIVCDMPLQELRILGKKRLVQLTTKAMLALQQGIFGRTVEKFPFDTWKSCWIKEKEKDNIKKGFRFMM